MSEKGRKKRSCFAIFAIVIIVAIILGVFLLSSKTPEKPTRKSFETAKLYLEYSANVSLVSENVFEYKNSEDAGMKKLSVNLTTNSISSPTSGKIDLVIETEKDEKISMSLNYILDDEELFLKFENTKDFIKGLNYADFLENLLSKEATDAIEKSNEDWILVDGEDIDFIIEALFADIDNPDEDLVCFDNFLDKYDQTTTRFITSTIDDEIEKYVFYTSDDRIEKLANEMKKCFPNNTSKHLVDKVVEIAEDFSGLTAELNDDSKITTLSVDNELEEYYFKSITTFDYGTRYFYPEFPEIYLTFDDLFKVDE